MNKEEFKQELAEFSDVDSVGAVILLEDILRRFFDSNVCIPKGSKIQVSKKETISMASFDDWITVSEYRIKPSEPVYEWQWLVMHHQAYIVSDYGRFMTLEETCDGMMPIEETKRVR